MSPVLSTSAVTIPSDAFLSHWQGHRRLTRRVIDAFPERELFQFSVGGMRPFSALALEMVSIASGGIRGTATREWPSVETLHARADAPTTKEGLLQLWDATTVEIDSLWAQIPSERFSEVDKAFGMWEGVVYGLVLYFIDNEIHHRGQGYASLRALGLEPPAFYDRN